MGSVQLLYDFKNKSTSNLEHLQHFDANGITVHPYKVLIIVTHQIANSLNYFYYVIIARFFITGHLLIRDY